MGGGQNILPKLVLRVAVQFFPIIKRQILYKNQSPSGIALVKSSHPRYFQRLHELFNIKDVQSAIFSNCDSSHGRPVLSRVWKHVQLSYVSLGTRPRYSQVVDADVKKPTNQTNRHLLVFCTIISLLSGFLFHRNL